MRLSTSSGLRWWRSCKKRLMPRLWAVELWTTGSITFSGLAIVVLLQVSTALMPTNTKWKQIQEFVHLLTTHMHIECVWECTRGMCERNTDQINVNLGPNYSNQQHTEILKSQTCRISNYQKLTSNKGFKYSRNGNVSYFGCSSITSNTVTPQMGQVSVALISYDLVSTYVDVTFW